MSTQCRYCSDGLKHCHGTVIIHVQRRAECTDDCDGPDLIAHTLRIDCNAVGCGCSRVAALVV